MIAFVAVVVALAALVVARVVTRTPVIPLGATAAADLLPGSCLAESERGLTEYTVVSCGLAHPQQVFAIAELELAPDVYALVDDAIGLFGDEVCARYLEYRLFLVPELEKNDYRAFAIAVPNVDEYAAGDTDALCAIAPRDESATLTGDLYRAMP
jgi:glutaminase